MTSSLAHRGPDGNGTWLGKNETVGLGQTRLAIIDLDGGEQPMISTDGRYVITFNGEIYNFQKLRNELEQHGCRFHTRSDTEVILEAFRVWGNESLKRFHGMFAFALFDKVMRQLFLARDPTGIKPLYYTHNSQGFFFGSEIKAILTCKTLTRRLNHKALADFFILGYPMLPDTFFRDVYELEPGTWLQVSDRDITIQHYWYWHRQEEKWDEAITLERSEEALIQSLEEHLVSDVPIGVFLSGGIDSSLLIALLVKQLGVSPDTFTVKFGESSYDESPYARIVANSFGVPHHQITLETDSCDLTVVNQIINQFDQPFGDSSAIPTYLICQEIRKHVKVAIGGDGGDEMFGGYPRFLHADAVQILSRTPNWLLAAGLASVHTFGAIAFAKESRGVQRLLRSTLRSGADRLINLSCYTYPETLEDILQPEVMKNLSKYQIALDILGKEDNNCGGREFIDFTIEYALPGDYLRKVDVMSSAHGLEVRVPFLGAQVLEHAAHLPNKLRYSASMNKIVLRRLAQRYLPDQIVRRPKAGFGIPLDSWIGEQNRKVLQQDLISSNSYINQIICPEWTKTILDSFVTGVFDHKKWSRFRIYQHTYFLWSLEQWLKRWQPIW